MQRGIAPHLRGLVVLATAVALLGSTGCFPGVAWLPDSSGLIYTSGKGFKQLVHYDLTRGEQKILVADTGAPTFWPAVSPDGKRIAVARIEIKEDKGPATLQVILYGRDGKEVQRSKVFPWTEQTEPRPPKDKSRPYPQLFWAPQGQGIIINDAANTNVGIYDPKTDRLINVKEGWLLSFTGGPVRPDGAGFLVMHNVKGFVGGPEGGDWKPRFGLVGWDGKEQAIKPPPLLLDEKALKKETDVHKLAALLNPYLYQSGWDGDVASVSWNVDRLRYFTKKGEAVIDSVKPLKADDGRLVQIRHQFPGGQAEVRVVSLHGVDNKASTEGVRLEVRKPGQRKAEVVLEQADFCLPTPSPNGRLVALWCVSDTRKGGEGRMDILVVDDKGRVTARVQPPR
jgi:hypothetical protein